MTSFSLRAIIEELRAHPAIQSKRAIAAAAKGLALTDRTAGRPGDDAAILPRGASFDLLAGEGFIPEFVNADPWFAGWCGVMVNLSDIAAMGGRATAMIDQVWAPNADAAQPLLDGLRDAAAAYGVPLVGGHSNFSAHELNLAVSVLGRATALITSFDATPGDVIVAAIDKRGAYRIFDNYFAAAGAPHQRLRDDLALLPELAESRMVNAGKDISQSGISGTALMLAEASEVAITLDLDAIAPPPGIPLARWLRSFPSFGFLLSVRKDASDHVCRRFALRDIEASVIGSVAPGTAVSFSAFGETETFWDFACEPYLGFRHREIEHA